MLKITLKKLKVNKSNLDQLFFCMFWGFQSLSDISSSPTRFAARYFNDAPPVFQRLFFTSEESSAVQYGPRRMKLRDLMGATLRFLQSDCAKFRMLWDWSPCVSQLLTSDVMVRGYELMCWLWSQSGRCTAAAL